MDGLNGFVINSEPLTNLSSIVGLAGSFDYSNNNLRDINGDTFDDLIFGSPESNKSYKEPLEQFSIHPTKPRYFFKGASESVSHRVNKKQ